LDKLVVLEVQL